MTTPNEIEQWSVTQSLEGLEILVTGATGFLGKVYASMLLRHHPDIEKLHLLIRPRTNKTPDERFDELLVRSPAFTPLQEIYGEGFEEFLDEKVDTVGGDITSENLGLEENAARDLSERLDVIINCAGLTNFNPNLENALSINTLSQRNFIEFIRLADEHAAYMHVSTCFVVATTTAGSKSNSRDRPDTRTTTNSASNSTPSVKSKTAWR